MKKRMIVASICAFVSVLVLISAPASGLDKDTSGDYQIGTYVTVAAVHDGTFTDTINCIPGVNGTACSGDAGFNQVAIYQVTVSDGIS